MAASSSTASPQLLAANKRLLALRALAQQQRAAAAVSSPASADGSDPSADRSTALPDHLGWGSAALTRALRASTEQDDAERDPDAEHPPIDEARSADPDINEDEGEGGDPATGLLTPADNVTLHPSIATAMLRHELAAAGRIWLLLRAIDWKGGGWVAVEDARALLTEQDAPLHVCGWRQLRNLLRQGQGTFWQRDSQRIWLRSAAKVAAALGVERLVGRSVDLPVRVLLDGIGAVRAHFYASFHSGRKSSNPISRGTLARLAAVPERTQRTYDKVAGVQSQPNYAVGDPLSDTIKEERAWQRGHATFELTDHQGKHGRAGQRYIAWQLPNSYTGCHKPHVTGRTKRINRTLKDLVNRRGQGNGGKRVRRVFFPDGAAAVRGLAVRHAGSNRHQQAKVPAEVGATNVYWRGGARCWYVFGR